MTRSASPQPASFSLVDFDGITVDFLKAQLKYGMNEVESTYTYFGAML